MKVKIGDTTFIHNFQIADIDGKVLLGIDIFRRQRCVWITIDTTSLDQTFQYCDTSGFPLVINVLCRRSVVVPSQSEKLIKGWMARFKRVKIEVMMEPRYIIAGLTVGISLHRQEGPS